MSKLPQARALNLPGVFWAKTKGIGREVKKASLMVWPYVCTLFFIMSCVSGTKWACTEERVTEKQNVALYNMELQLAVESYYKVRGQSTPPYTCDWYEMWSGGATGQTCNRLQEQRRDIIECRLIGQENSYIYCFNLDCLPVIVDEDNKRLRYQLAREFERNR